MRDATVSVPFAFLLITFQSTRPIRDATFPRCHTAYDLMISIHASHAGRDHNSRIYPAQYHHFNPRVPCGTRPTADGLPTTKRKFQSTRPMRDATSFILTCQATFYFNPRVPCGTRHGRNGFDRFE